MKKLKLLLLGMLITALSISVPTISVKADSQDTTVTAPSNETDPGTVSATATDVAPAPVPDKPAVVNNLLELPTTTGSSVGTMLFIMAGMVFYFFLAWRRAKLRNSALSFEIGSWFNGNWFNLIVYAVGIVVLYYNSGAMHPVAAFMLGMAPNAIIDWAQKEAS